MKSLKIKIGLALSLVLLFNLSPMGGVGGGSLYAADKTFTIDKNLSIYYDVMRQIDMNYVDTLNYKDLTETAINAMLKKIDPYTVYYPKSKDDELKMMTTGKYGGIGAMIQQREVETGKKDKERITIIADPYEGKPAQLNGIMAGDRILAVDGWETKDHTVSEVSDHLRGTPATTVTLKLQREGLKKPFEVSFPRQEVRIDPIEYSTIFQDTIAYICLREFTTGCANDFARTLNNLVQQGAKRLIFDLRGNGGGIVDEAISIVSNFVDRETEVVYTKGKLREYNRSYITTSYPAYPNLPLIILVDGNSASASEIVSGSLQDLHRATLIGERTFGKGLVQNLRTIAYDGHLKVTTSKYYLPSGRCIQAIDYAERQKGKTLHKDTAGGILPDIVMADSQKVDITYTLYIKNMFFDYATRYRLSHDTIVPEPQFEVTDEILENFCAFLDEKEFTYETETGKYFKDMIRMAEHEDLDSAVIAQLRDLEPALKPNFREAIARHKDEVKSFLGGEIISRYYYQKGKFAFMLRDDEVLKKALEL